jgi:hypothetical protein
MARGRVMTILSGQPPAWVPSIRELLPPPGPAGLVGSESDDALPAAIIIVAWSYHC